MVMDEEIGKRYGRLTVIERAENHITSNGKQYRQYLCICDCGAYSIVQGARLRSGKTKSCGCLALESRTKHSLQNTRLYAVWKHMKERCLNSNAPRFHNYGGRGITICDEWKNDFKTFYDWAIANGYREGLTIDRIDNNGNYEPSNCRWISNLEQQRNRSDNHFLTYNGETKTISEWSEITGINANTLHSRIVYRGWSVEKSLTTIPNRKVKNARETVAN